MSISLENDVVQSMGRALIYGAILDGISAPTPAQQWLERAAQQLREDRDPSGIKRGNRDKAVIRIMSRDGGDCFYCGGALGRDVTLEHLTPLALGGSWDDDNLALAHRRCNSTAGHLTRFEKEQLRQSTRESALPNKRADSNQ